tara:strand:+ start:585 stop:842 length:258 start_codon:yes stop_codon:yes gene_type:complete
MLIFWLVVLSASLSLNSSRGVEAVSEPPSDTELREYEEKSSSYLSEELHPIAVEDIGETCLESVEVRDNVEALKIAIQEGESFHE